MLRAVFFDLDGTLADTERQNAESVARALGRRGRPITDEERHFVIGHGWKEIYDHLAGAGGVDVAFDELVRLAGEERKQLVDDEGLDVLPGAVEAVRLVAARYPTAIVSGSSRDEIAMCLRALGVTELFPWFVGAEDTSRGKPAPDGYLLASRRMEVAPADCLVIEDSTAGIRAARAAGMRCVAVRAGNFARQPQDEADLVIDDLRQLDGALLARLSDGNYHRR
jgi:HAD superfamily hydrolase (TIGR01509 family)